MGGVCVDQYLKMSGPRAFVYLLMSIESGRNLSNQVPPIGQSLNIRKFLKKWTFLK